MQTKVILWCMILAGAAAGRAATDHYAISAMNVAETVSRAGIAVSPDRIALPAEVVATTLSPALRVHSVEKLGNDRLLARVECVKSSQCLPFLVQIQLREGSEAKIDVPGAEATKPLRTMQADSALALRSGSPVTLMLDGDHVHVRMRAICLQGGAPGQIIRVTDTNHRLIYSAQVVGTSLVQGRLK